MVSVQKHLHLTYDLGTMLASDANDFDDTFLRNNKNEYLLNLTRDNTQLLLNQIWELPTERVEKVIIVKLPPQETILPHMKPVPESLTKWQQFAKEKGIQKKKKNKLTWDDTIKMWIPNYGFKKKIMFMKVKVPRMGMVNPSSAKGLQIAVAVAKGSTASVGKFQSKLPKEKEATGVAELVPGVSRKRKHPPVSGAIELKEHLTIVDSIFSKRPKLDIEIAVGKQVTEHLERTKNKQIQSSKQKSSNRKLKGGGGK